MSKSINQIVKFKWIMVSIVGIASFLHWQNKGIVQTQYEYTNPKIPKAFNNYRMLHVSDLHNALFGKNQSKLIEYTKRANPDSIVITGDLIDCHRTDIDTAMMYVKEAIKIAPIYYVSGNHEAWGGLNDLLTEKLTQLGVKVLNDEVTYLWEGNDKIKIIGLQDKMVPDTQQQLEKLTQGEDELFTLLLSHRPEYMPLYSSVGVELALSGHAHGGQIRIPFIGGMYAPGQGIWPQYTRGVHRLNETTMIISRGLGNSVFPFRIFNRPEMVTIILKS